MWLTTFLHCGSMPWRKLHLFYFYRAVCACQARASFKIMLRRWGRAPGKRKAGEAKDDIQSSNSQLTAYPLVSGVDHLQERGKKLRDRNRECARGAHWVPILYLELLHVCSFGFSWKDLDTEYPEGTWRAHARSNLSYVGWYFCTIWRWDDKIFGVHVPFYPFLN